MKKWVFILLIDIILSNDNYSKEYNDLIIWLKSNGAKISNKITINEKEENNRFIYSTTNIKKYEELIFIPDSLILSFQNKILSEHCRKMYGISNKYDYECLVYFLSIDLENKKSFFSPYYNYLTKINLNNLGFNYSGKQILKYRNTGIDTEIRMAQYYFENTLEPLKDYFQSKIKIDNKLRDNFKKSFFIVSSRNFVRNESIKLYAKNCLVPLLDLINHNNTYNTNYTYTKFRKGFILYSVRDIVKGEQIYINYGKLNNIDLFVKYDFIIKDNIYKCDVSFIIKEKKYKIKGNFNMDNLNLLINNVCLDFKVEKKESVNFIISGLKEKKNLLKNLLKSETNLKIKNILEEQISTINKGINVIYQL